MTSINNLSMYHYKYEHSTRVVAFVIIRTVEDGQKEYPINSTSHDHT